METCLVYHCLYQEQKTFMSLCCGEVSCQCFLPANVVDQPLKDFLQIYNFQMHHLSLCVSENIHRLPDTSCIQTQ